MGPDNREDQIGSQGSNFWCLVTRCPPSKSQWRPHGDPRLLPLPICNEAPFPLPSGVLLGRQRESTSITDRQQWAATPASRQQWGALPVSNEEPPAPGCQWGELGSLAFYFRLAMKREGLPTSAAAVPERAN